MVELKNKQILIDGKPQLLIGGEVHYFRLKRAEWQDRIDKLKASGCNTIGSYIPWISHEEVHGEVDLTGRTRTELDLGAFIDLCRDNGLFFFARPGPFIMAEMKNEGLPYWVYDENPAAIPVTWDGKTAPTRTLDYLEPGFLKAAHEWYRNVMGVLVPRLQPNGGNVVAVQLDNEIGMLSWVSNSPDMTDGMLDSFVDWLKQQYSAAELERRYPFPLDNAAVRNHDLRAPREDYAPELMHDLGYFMRVRFTRYVATLRAYAEEFGIKDVPFVINVHGTDQGRGLSFPIGISQLYEAYTQAPEYLAGTDHYIGDLAMHNFQDLYLINAFMDAVNLPNQPLSSVEFEAGSGDYGNDYAGRQDPSTVEFKLRMCVAQGNKLINYYLFTGGINYLLDHPQDDGNMRIAFTGERHGFGAPVNPEGVLSYTFGRLTRGNKAMLAVGDKLAAMSEQHDPLAFAFIPDYYMTESRYPTSASMKAIVDNITANRGANAWGTVARAMLLGGYRFGAVDIQNRDFSPKDTPALVVPSARYMSGALQQKLVDYLKAGGKALLYGELPLYDMEANPCTLLAEALGLTHTGERQGETFYFLSLKSVGWAAPHPEIRTYFAQTWDNKKGEKLIEVVGTDLACGFDIEIGKGRAIVLTCAYNTDVDFFRAIFERLGAKAALRQDDPQHGVFMTSSANGDERFLHILNLDGYDKEIHIIENGAALLGGRALKLARREALLLPLNVAFDGVRIAYSTAEIAAVHQGGIDFRLTQDADVIALKTDKQIAASDKYSVEQREGLTVIHSRQNALLDDKLSLRWS